MAKSHVSEEFPKSNRFLFQVSIFNKVSQRDSINDISFEINILCILS